jgi:AraC family transcriptional regulator of adaptative response / methylphosphotriester-DNA alkyltransferase methyltransferase
MERAAELLRIRGLTVRDVAHRVGYRQPAQFAKAFRRHHGIAPSDFRANGRFGSSSTASAVAGVTAA